jgi:hypothetical protein
MFAAALPACGSMPLASQHGGSLQAAGLGMVSEDPGCMTVSGGKLACGQWTKHEGSLNCYDGKGAPGAAGDSDFTAIPLDDCKRACLEDASGCQAIVVKAQKFSLGISPNGVAVSCWLRKEVVPEECVHGSDGYDLFTVARSPSPVPQPSSQASPAVALLKRRVVLFGAIGRHNFGDLIMAEVHAALLKLSRPELPMVFADLLSADMTQYGGQRVAGISSLFDSAETTDVIHVGGDTLGPSLNAALEMIDHKPAGEEAIARQLMRAARFSNSTRSAYLLHKQLFRHPKTFVVNAVGGWPWPDDMPALAGADYVGTRNPLQGVHHLPDPVVLLHRVLAKDVLAATKSDALQAIRQATKGRPYWAVQLSDDFAASNSTDALADQLCSASRREKSLAIVLFRAGAIHDSLPALENVQASMRRTCAPDLPIAVFEELNIFRICAVISEAALLVSTSLHTRIVALNYHVPRVTFSARPEVSKHSFFVQHWDDLYASDDALKTRRARVACPKCAERFRDGAAACDCDAEFRQFCGWNNVSKGWNPCGGVVPVQSTAAAIEAALDAGALTNWTTTQSGRCRYLASLQEAAIEEWMPLL